MVVIDKEKCIGCGMCAADCVGQIIQIVDGTAEPSRACIQCGHCVAICPEGAVSIPEYDMDDIESYEEGKFNLDPEQFLRAVKYRRSIRAYKPEKITCEELKKIGDAGRYSATAANTQTCKFVFVQDRLDEMKKIVWDYVEAHKDETNEDGTPVIIDAIKGFNERRKADPKDDFLFRNAPALTVLTSKFPLDAGLAAQNMEMMAYAMGIGFLYNGYLVRMITEIPELQEWLGIKGKTVCAVMLMGHPDVHYERTVPRKEAQIIWR